jgi:hypothetical protein
MHCSARRTAAGDERTSSNAPTTANSAAAAVSTSNWPPSFCGNAGDRPAAPQTTASVAATTAMPPPCGVGSRCDERAFGRAMA